MKKVILISFLFVPIFASASIDINLKYGATGPEVVELQEFLIDKGFLVYNATGNFFSLTNSAVVQYQGSVGLPTTGFVGPMTREKINAELVAKTDIANKQEVVETGSVSTVSVNDRITQMLNQIKVLQELIAKQNQTQQSALTSIQQIQQNTTPAPVYVPPAPVIPAPVQFTATKEESSTPNRCFIATRDASGEIFFDYRTNDGVDVVLGRLILTPNPTTLSKKVTFKARINTSEMSSDLSNKPFISTPYGTKFINEGQINLDLESFGIGDPTFWLKEIKAKTIASLTVDSMTVDGIKVLGLPVSFSTVNVHPCQ